MQEALDELRGMEELADGERLHSFFKEAVAILVRKDIPHESWYPKYASTVCREDSLRRMDDNSPTSNLECQ